MAAVVEAVADALIQAGIQPGARLMAGFSGGLDSSVLLHTLVQLRERFSFDLSAHHVHHGLSSNADEWADHCMSVCLELGVPCRVSRVEVASSGRGVEAAARDARHRAWSSENADWWVTAHHLDDQVETLMFRLLRGAGVAGAAAMHPIIRADDGPGRLRPLLGLSRAALASAAEGAGLRWIEDESNANTRYARNFLRQEVLPLMRSRFAGADATLARAAGHFADAADMLDDLAALDAEACGGGPLDRRRFDALTLPRRANLVRYLMCRMAAPMPDEARLNEALRQIAHAAPERGLCFPFGVLWLHAYRHRVWLTPELPAVPDAPSAFVTGEGSAWGEGVVRAEATIGTGLHLEVLNRGMLTLRTRWPGCRMRLSGRPEKDFKQLAQEAGIPPVERDRLPVLCLDEVPVWIAEIGYAESVGCLDGERGIVLSWVRPPAYRAAGSAIA